MKQILQGSLFAAWLYASLILLSVLLLNLVSELLSGTPVKFLSNLAENWLALLAIYTTLMTTLFAVLVFCGLWARRSENDPSRTKRWRDHERNQLAKQWRSRKKRQ